MTAAAYDRSLLARALRVAATLLLVVLPALHAADGIAQAGATSVPGLRLPRDVVPLAYDARLRVDPNDDAFSGVIDITVRVLEPTDIVWLNAKKLTILDAQGAILATPEEVLPATVLPGSDDVIGLQFARVLAAGEVRLSLRYTGSIQRTSGVGLFRQQEASRWYAVTQFEPLDARRVFPSFDEPDRKATWKLTLTVPAAMRAFANMPVEAERAAEKGWREVSFQRSPPLPSYLVAFAVGEFDVRDGGRAGVNNTPISIITPKGRAAEAAYAATHTGTILAATERYFGRPYPFPKLDLLAYPLATFGGAMENAGLITYTARNLLARPEEMSPRFEQRFVGITAHEIAHMWFGDYVTMAWWNDLWLNESFASWMASTITNELRPDWSRDGWRSRQRSVAMEIDRLVTARSIRQPVTEYGEVRAAFDGITYAKGETILTMFEQWLGADKFREGVRRYIGKHAWGNATAEDFFAALAADDDALVPALRGFVERAGVPLLDVALDCSGPPVLKLAQQRFLPVGTPPQKGEKWAFPACFEFGDAKRGRQVCALVNEATQVVRLPAGACPQWVVANRGGLGYYLPRLTPALYAALPQAEPVLAPADYAGLLGDLAMLSGNGALAFEIVLPIAARQAVNADAQAARRAYELAGSVPTAMVDAANGPRYAAWLRNHFGDRARALGWLARKGESPDVLRLRDTAVALVADRGQDTALARKAQQLAQRWLTHRSAIPRESLQLVLVGAARSGGKDAPRLFDALLLLVKSSKDANERRDVYAALVAFRDPALLTRALAIILEPQFHAREAGNLLEDAFADPATRPTALAWFAANAPAIALATPPEMQAAFPVWASDICTGAERAQFVAAFEALPTQREGGARTYRESLEKIDGCLALRRARQAPFNAYLGALK